MSEPNRDRVWTPYLIDPPSWPSVILRYAAAMMLVASIFAGVAYNAGRVEPDAAPSENQDALLVDLAPVEASNRPLGDDAPAQQAAPASAGIVAPHQPPTPKAAAPLQPAGVPNEAPALSSPSPADVPARLSSPPLAASAPPLAPQVQHTAGVPQLSRNFAENDSADTETRHASAHLITLWQKALMERLQTARLGLTHGRLESGLVKVAFAIDRDGKLLSEHIAHGSGSAVLDDAALVLVRRAAPFPIPPRDAREAELSFVVPVSFKR